MTISRMLYIDDSGSVASGFIIYGWIECSPDRWRNGLRAILELRKRLYRDYLVPPATELHATKFINGRNRISTNGDDDGTQWKTLGRSVAVDCLEMLRDCPDVKIGAVWRRTTAKGAAYSAERAALYSALVEKLNTEHRSSHTYAFVGMDGDGSNPTYLDAHRALLLDTRHIIEDPMFHDSRRSQWMQMADLVAYAVFTHLNRHPGNEFGWNWYEHFLQAKPTGVPDNLLRL
jgi:hypothetical protein